MSSEEVEQLRSNADNLAKCLHALLERIETLERKDKITDRKDENGKERPEKDEQVAIEDSVSVDPVTGLKKRTIVTERNGRLLSPAYQSRIVQIDARQLSQLEVESIGGQLVVTRVEAEATHDIHPGDTITEVDGRPTLHTRDLENLKGRITLSLVPASLHHAPSVFYRSQGEYCSLSDPERPCQWLEIDVRRGDVLQVMSRDEKWLQARKVNDLSRVGYVPSSVQLEKVSLLCPFGRRVLVLLGCVGVGRRTLKNMLLRAQPHLFATVIPLTSRAPRTGEQEGREYQFLRKEDMLQKIREGGMVEWGELDSQLYGTSAESVRGVVRGGRMCVVDCAPQALSYLYNGEFMPFVVHVVPPPLEEFVQLESLRRHKRPVDELSKVCAESDGISHGPHAHQIHLTLINRNVDVTHRRLLDALENLRCNTQWVPDSWIC